ncbi:hypothetical protein C8F04DRAFT_1072326 [Mycena alexandri]|uniref:Uncharacterized protein n=1 Tax=Mycena alexandri TaxID=1745969 RepID=A0AAD6TGI8_9AGAR|nr:hypothetical protein C8F04DRAFT_1072326 [Mycena alexandri]
MQSWLYIAFYRRARLGSYHWTIIPSELETGPLDDTQEFQISDLSGGWELAHRDASRKLCSLPKELPLVGCVRLPTVDIDKAEITAFISEYGASDDAPPGLRDPHWSGARWVLRIVRDLVEAGLLSIGPRGSVESQFEDGLHRKIMGRVMQLEAAPTNGESFSGIRVIGY